MPVNINYLNSSVTYEIYLRIFMTITFFFLETTAPFYRKIHPEEYWLYKNPETKAYVSGNTLFSFILSVPILLIIYLYLRTRDKNDVVQGLLGLTLSLGLTGVITDVIKLVVGRPRPSFFARCFPDGNIKSDMQCHADTLYVRDGRKSFPSGHSSFAFCSMTYTSLYLAGKLHIFSSNSPMQGIKTTIFLFPFVIAMLIAISRTCDYHHHWEDVLVGSILGITLSVLCYRQYYPSITSELSHLTHLEIENLHNRKMKSNDEPLSMHDNQA